jgi:hypothetical protein
MKFKDVPIGYYFDWSPGNVGKPLNQKISAQYWGDDEADYRQRKTTKEVYNVRSNADDYYTVYPEIFGGNLTRVIVKKMNDAVDLKAFI